MDIRNFFGGGGGGGAKKISAAPSTPSATTSKKTTSSSEQDTKKPVVAKSTKKSPQEQSEETVGRSTMGKKKEAVVSSTKEPKKEKKELKLAAKKRVVIDFDSDTDDDFVSTAEEKKETMKSASTKETKKETKESKPAKKRVVIDFDSDTDDDFVSESTPKEKPKSTHSPKSSAKKRKVVNIDESDDDYSCKDDAKEIATPSPSKPKKRKATPKKEKPKKVQPIKPSTPIESYPDPLPGVFDGLTFVFTGVMENLPRDDAIDYIKSYGGRVTTAVSGKTNYLVIGTILEDGRGIEEGMKYKKSKEIGDEKIVILNGEGELYALAKILDEMKKKELGISNNANTVKVETPAPATPLSITNSYAKKGTPVVNPYAKASSAASVVNPYAKKTSVVNPYAVSSNTNVTNPYAAQSPSDPIKRSCSGGGRADVGDPNALWADKYAPGNSRMILGNKESVSKLSNWLQSWESTFNRPAKGKKKSYNAKNGPFKAALLSGPPGIGKTTTAQLVVEESGRQVLELNASDARSKKTLEISLGDVTGSQVLSFDAHKKHGKKGAVKRRCIIMDEVDGMGAGDRGGMVELIKVIKSSMVPIICICNDRQSQKIKTLATYCLDLRYKRPVKTVIARRAIEVGKAEGMDIEYNAAEAVVESCGNDIRQVLNCLQMWGNKRHKITNKKTDMTYKDYKVRDNLINKDEMLRVTLFDAARMICEGRRGLADTDAKTQLDSFFKRTNAFFSDYALMGLLVHQNYIKIAVKPFLQTKMKGDANAEHQALVDLYKGTEAMSDYAVAEHGVRSGDQNWGLLPFCAILSLKSGYHCGGENGGFLPGFPEFSSWLGKNSSRGKRDRLLQEFGHHMNYKISADKTELRLGYLPAIRDQFVNLMMPLGGDGPNVEGAIGLMDDYGLDRDDIFENIDEFVLDRKTKRFADLDSKTKSAFTREYNKGVHKSQALIEEQGAPSRKRKKIVEEDDEDNEGEDNGDDDDDDGLSPDEIRKMFASNKRGKKKATPKPKKSKK